MWAKHKIQSGFTIVELLIVIVVIAVLAAITIVAYNGIQNRASDTAVTSDLKSTAKLFELYKVDKGVYPLGDGQPPPAAGGQLASLGLKATRSAYGNGFAGGVHNFIYCRVAADGPDKFALVASSKSGSLFTYKSETGAITKSAAWVSTSSTTICQDAGINQTVGTDRDIFYYSSQWQTYVPG